LPVPLRALLLEMQTYLFVPSRCFVVCKRLVLTLLNVLRIKLAKRLGVVCPVVVFLVMTSGIVLVRKVLIVVRRMQTNSRKDLSLSGAVQ
jgi:hypothetical protein